MVTGVGIDAGGTLLKLAYSENGTIKYRKSEYGQAESLLQWLKMLAPQAEVYLTGGKARWVKEKFFPDAELKDEFSSICTGATILFSKQADSAVGSYLLVNIGTGTSILLAGKGKGKRVGGSGLGGGTFMGLGQLLANTSDFEEMVNLVSKGDRRKTDLLVKDIYGDGGEPLAAEMTAANFGKLPLGGRDDHMAALVNMLAETLVLLSSQAALAEKVETVVFAGSTLTGNKPFKEALSAYTSMFGLKPIILENGEYCGALGALLQKDGSL
ncbi:type II pantothenate kinase [Bacillus sp. B-jedd]|uniref:type II pantothenate kinase n=1 Tax=Bacillus sp. B-jedd TaxID=1476857 RepID=UPI0005155482|nr:type II pantothenate kinase [Bacillus sp. B-jedd]CEG26972.1 pantothenate kinase [Bacillus sp. B-jedd]